MKLAEFIRNNVEAILQEWEQFARSIQPNDGDMDKIALRDHAKLMLKVIADDLDVPENKQEQIEKSKGQNPASAVDSAAGTHGLERLRSGFGITTMVSEYRFLRATVIRLWSEHSLTEPLNKDYVRFNEVLDQLIFEAIGSFSGENDRQAQLCDTALSSSSDNSYILDLDGKFMHANKPMLQLFQFSLDELEGKTHFDLNFSAAAEIQNTVRQVIQTAKKHRGEVKHTLPSGEERDYEYVIAPVFDHEKKVGSVVATERDITDRKLAEERAWYNANHDVLTGLPNRRFFLDRLDHEIKHATRTGTSLALLFIDLDGFKKINDLRGHDTGDQVLKQVAQRLVPCVRAADTVARLGGDEFTIILQEPGGIEHTATVARKIVKLLALPFSIFNETVTLSACIGIAIFPQDATEPELLLKNADQAMYAAKLAGASQFCFFIQKMQPTVSAGVSLLRDLRQALLKQQLEVFYQPIIDLSDGERIVKAEALLRWHHPEKGLLLPREFINLTEEEGLMGYIDSWVFGEAVAHSIAWSELLGIPFQISVNTSAAQLLADPNTRWVDYAKQVDLGKARVSLEVAGGNLLEVSQDVTDKLTRLHQAGIQLSIGDFGKGCASSAFLKKFDVDYLKIDQSFVHDFAEGTSNLTHAESIILMAHNLGVKAIAEGVETVAQKNWLTEMDCDYAQGYLFSEAVPPAEFEQLLKAGGRRGQYRLEPCSIYPRSSNLN